jgi:hypothetical protein
MALGLTQPLTEMSTRNLPGRSVRLTNLLSSVSRLCRENVGASTSHNHTGFHSLLQRQLYLLFTHRAYIRESYSLQTYSHAEETGSLIMANTIKY